MGIWACVWVWVWGCVGVRVCVVVRTNHISILSLQCAPWTDQQGSVEIIITSSWCCSTATIALCMAWSFTEHSLLNVYKEEFDYDEDDVVNRRYSYVALDDCPLEKPYPCGEESVSEKGIGENNDYNSDHNYSSDITLVNQHW